MTRISLQRDVGDDSRAVFFYQVELAITSRRRLNRRNSFKLKSSDMDESTVGSSSSSTTDVETLKEQASKLRQEANELETALRSSGSVDAAASQPPPVAAAPVTCQNLEDSTWTFKYRFASEPEPRKNDDDETHNRKPSEKFSGQVQLKFRSDGFTDLLAHDPLVSSTSSGKALDIVKAWGWDVENSTKDDKNYVLFSLDAIVPGSGKKERFYLQ